MRISYFLSFGATVAVFPIAAGKSLRGPEEEGRQLQPAKIVGGEDSSFSEFPFFVNITVCGASLIHEDIVLTGK